MPGVTHWCEELVLPSAFPGSSYSFAALWGSRRDPIKASDLFGEIRAARQLFKFLLSQVVFQVRGGQ